MTCKPNGFSGKSRRGSALLIVLGFLSFMMISAVAFAVYMRIERQASSNYRHAAGARHILNAGLYRAIEDVDYELRNNNEADFSRKFPLFLSNGGGRCRVLTSVTDDTGADSQQARVLSLDGLAYIPGILVNHVRSFAISEGNGSEWRSVSMPYSDMNGSPSYNESIVGRYAYACINVSDMINVNNCLATARGSGSNQVSIAYLFENAGQCDTFEKNRETDIYYHTLNDFYACMYEHNDPVFYSPYHEFLDSLDATVKPFDRKEMENHIVVTDGKVKAEPRGDDACNILEAGLLPDMSQNNPSIGNKFYDAFVKSFPAGFNGNNDYKTAFARMLVDYLDEDHIPKSFDYPSTEIAPMICQMSVMAPGFPIFEKRQTNDIDGDGNPDDEIFLNLSRIPAPLNFSVKTVYPYLQTLNQKNLGQRYEIEVEAYLRVHSISKRRLSRLGAMVPDLGNNFYASYSAKHTFSVDNNIRNGGVDPNEPYHLAPLEMVPSLIGGNQIVIWDSINGGQNGFIAGEPVVVTLVVSFVGIKDAAGNYVDVFPNVLNPKAPSIPRYVDALHKPYFETIETGPLSAAFNIAAVPNFDHASKWTCLETPDPRFNWKVSNWMKSVDPAAQEKPNQSTLTLLNDGTGRDGDIFLFASNAEELQSPGELGFLIRPYQHNLLSPGDVNFATQVSVDNCTDKEAMFRTIRLYDHGAAAQRDSVFDFFYAADSEKFMLGTRINPLSDIPNVLRGAMENVPMDYCVAYRNYEDIRDGDEPTLRDYNFTEDNEFKARWPNIVDAWQQKLESAIQNPPTVGGREIDVRRRFGCNLRDMYYDHGAFNWYDAQRDTIFGQSFGGVELYEVDRKMLYSFSLDSFSDRQQLFLYFINAETTASAFGSRSRSTAGGKAVALVWRDPYPSGYKRLANGAQTPEPAYATRFHNYEILYFQYLDN